MKRNIIVCVIVTITALLIGFTAGFYACDTAEKIIEEHGSMKTIITMFCGHQYTYDVDKTSYFADRIDYTLVKGVSK